jgi:hypothetical protein
VRGRVATTIGGLAGLLLVAACASSRTSASHTGGTGSTTSSLGPGSVAVLATADQPPDPCSLLSARDVSQAFGRAVKPLLQRAPLGHAPDGARTCSWVTASAAKVAGRPIPGSPTTAGYGVVTVSISTDRALAAGADLEREKYGGASATLPAWLRLARTATHQFALATAGIGRHVSGIGSNAMYVPRSSSLTAVSSDTMIVLSFIGASGGDHLAELSSLMRAALAAAG